MSIPVSIPPVRREFSDSPLFWACRSGNINDVKSALLEGDSIPTSITPTTPVTATHIITQPPTPTKTTFTSPP